MTDYNQGTNLDHNSNLDGGTGFDAGTGYDEKGRVDHVIFVLDRNERPIGAATSLALREGESPAERGWWSRLAPPTDATRPDRLWTNYWEGEDLGHSPSTTEAIKAIRQAAARTSTEETTK